MSQEDFDAAISAAWDGEPVDLNVLREALRTPDGREALASLLLFRAAAGGRDIDPRDGQAAAAAASIAASGRARYLRGPRVPLGLAATLAALAIAGTVWMGSLTRPVSMASGGPSPSAPVPPIPAPASEPAPARASASQPCPPVPSVPSPRADGRMATAGAMRQPPTPVRIVHFAGWRDGS